MKTIRHNTYETNSSSTHSITIDTENYKNVQVPKTMTIPLGKFGWEYVKFNDFLTKASYFWTLGLYDTDIFDCMVRLAADYGFDLEFKTNEDDFFYVDHGSEHYAGWVKKNPELKTDEGLWNFLINESCWIFLGNDNSEEHVNWRMTDKHVKALPYCVYIAPTDYNDHIDYEDASFKTELPTIAENASRIANHMNYILEKERVDEPYASVREVSDEGLIKVEYRKWIYAESRYAVVKKKTFQATMYAGKV